MGLIVPETHGGLGLGTLDLALVLRGARSRRGAGTVPRDAARRRGTAARPARRRSARPGCRASLAGEAFATLALPRGRATATIPPASRRPRGRRATAGRSAATKLFVLEAPGGRPACSSRRARRRARGAAGVSLFLVERAARGVRVRSREQHVDLTRRFGELTLRRTSRVPADGAGRACGPGMAAAGAPARPRLHRHRRRQPRRRRSGTIEMAVEYSKIARAVRPQDRLVPGDEAHRGGDGGRRRAGALPGLVRGVRLRPPPEGGARAPPRWRRRASATSTAARRGARSRCTAASASPGSSTCSSGSSART